MQSTEQFIEEETYGISKMRNLHSHITVDIRNALRRAVQHGLELALELQSQLGMESEMEHGVCNFENPGKATHCGAWNKCRDASVDIVNAAIKTLIAKSSEKNV